MIRSPLDGTEYPDIRLSHLGEFFSCKDFNFISLVSQTSGNHKILNLWRCFFWSVAD